MRVSEMTFGSLFAGIGGFDLGLERAGMTCRWQVEIDPFCQRVLAKHWPDVKRYGDIRECGDNLERVDLICGGFPCQDVSTANGSGRGLAGERSGLWFEYARIVGLLRPSYVVVENVANLFNRGIGDVLGGLAAMGYDAEWGVVRASDVGAPHPRARVWIVAYPQRPRLAGRDEGPRVFGSTPPPYAQPSDGPFGGWSDLDAAIRGVPHLHGVSVQMVRDRIKPYGNAIVPQIAEWIGRQILTAEESRTA